MSYSVTLTPEDIARARQAARDRLESNSRHGCTQRLVDRKRSWESNGELGMWGEVGFEKWSGIPADYVIGPRVGSADFPLKNGLHVDVKSTRKGGRLLAVRDYELDRPKGDIYVLAIVDQAKSEVEIVGWLTKAEVQAIPVTPNWLNNGPVHLSDRSKLHPMDELGVLRPKKRDLNALML